jgi:hypothetical protein
MKKCRKCGIIKPYSEFKKDNRNKGGAGSPCLECYKIYLNSPHQKEGSYLRVKKWWSLNKEKMRGNPKLLKRWREYQQKNKEKIKIYNKQYCKKNRENYRIWAKRFPEKQRAREKTRHLIRIGIIKKPENCQICNEKIKLQVHHKDYSNHLDVIFLCLSCHKKQHHKYKEQ